MAEPRLHDTVVSHRMDLLDGGVAGTSDLPDHSVDGRLGDFQTPDRGSTALDASMSVPGFLLPSRRLESKPGVSTHATALRVIARTKRIRSYTLKIRCRPQMKQPGAVRTMHCT